MDALVAKYSEPPTLGPAAHEQSAKTPAATARLTVLLTGSTGFLGLRILQALLSMPEVAHVHCLDRDRNAGTRVLNVLKQHPDLKTPEGKASFHTVQLAVPRLGLSEPVYSSLAQEADVILHNAWKIDFNESLDSYAPVHLGGVANLVTLARAGARRPRLTFFSSVSTVAVWAAVYPEETPVPEKVVHDSRVAAGMGYAQSKQVGERIVAAASDRSDGMPATILRVAQIAGPVTSADAGPAWSPDQWLPAALASCRLLGCVPDWLPAVDWMPVDKLGGVIAQIVLYDAQRTPDDKEAAVYHLANPRQVPWSQFTSTISKRLGGVDVIPYATWLAKLQALDAGDAAVLEAVPALKMRGFFEALGYIAGQEKLPLSLERAVAASADLRDMQAIKLEWLEGWMEVWGL